MDSDPYTGYSASSSLPLVRDSGSLGGALLGRPGATMGRRICDFCRPSPSPRAARARVQHCQGVLPSDGPWSYHGGRVQKGYRDARAGICWLVMDNAVDSLVGHLCRWAGAAWHASELFPRSTLPREGARRYHHWYTKNMIVIL